MSDSGRGPTVVCCYNRHVEVLYWARARGCDRDEKICVYLAKNVHLEVLQWARAHGCPLDNWTCVNAAR